MVSTNSNDNLFLNGNLEEFDYVVPEYSSTMVAFPKGETFGFRVVFLE